MVYPNKYIKIGLMKETKIGDVYYNRPVTAFAAWLMEESGATSLGHCLGCFLSDEEGKARQKYGGKPGGTHNAFQSAMEAALIEFGADAKEVKKLTEGGIGGDLTLSHWVEAVERIFFSKKEK